MYHINHAFRSIVKLRVCAPPFLKHPVHIAFDIIAKSALSVENCKVLINTSGDRLKMFHRAPAIKREKNFHRLTGVSQFSLVRRTRMFTRCTEEFCAAVARASSVSGKLPRNNLPERTGTTGNPGGPSPPLEKKSPRTSREY